MSSVRSACPSCAGTWTSTTRPSTRSAFGKGQMGSALIGVTANFMILTGTFWVLPLTYLYLPNSARTYLFPQSVKIRYFCSGPIRVDPICPQPRLLHDMPRRHDAELGGDWEQTNTPLLRCHPDGLTITSKHNTLLSRMPRGCASDQPRVMVGLSGWSWMLK